MQRNIQNSRSSQQGRAGSRGGGGLSEDERLRYEEEIEAMKAEVERARKRKVLKYEKKHLELRRVSSHLATFWFLGRRGI